MKINQLLAIHAPAAMGISARQAEEIRRAFADARSEPTLTAARRGPSGGPDASIYNVSLLLLAAWSGADRKFSAAVAMKLHAMQIAGDDGMGQVAEVIADYVPLSLAKLCPITGQGSFGAALMALLREPSLAEQVSIEVRHDGRAAAIHTMTGGMLSRFADGDVPQMGMHIKTVVDGRTLAAVARSLAEGE